jgi:hypothetical protein
MAAAPQGHRQNNTGAAQFVIPAQSNATSAESIRTIEKYEFRTRHSWRFGMTA